MFVQSAKLLAMYAGEASGEANDTEFKCQTKEVKTCICHQSNFQHMNLPLADAQTVTAHSITCQGMPKITVTEHFKYFCSQYSESNNFCPWSLRLFLAQLTSDGCITFPLLSKFYLPKTINIFMYFESLSCFVDGYTVSKIRSKMPEVWLITSV